MARTMAGAPSAMANVAHWEVFTGATNQSLIVNTATAEPVYLTIHYSEVP